MLESSFSYVYSSFNFFSDLSSSVIRAPRYVNVWTFSIIFPSMCILVLGGLLLLENTIVYVFFAFSRSPKLSLSLLTWSMIFWRSSSVSASNIGTDAIVQWVIPLCGAGTSVQLVIPLCGTGTIVQWVIPLY